jgi:Glycosyl hydrolase family 65 central catalytic domain
MMLEIARFWASLANYNPQRDRYEIHGVMGRTSFTSAIPAPPTEACPTTPTPMFHGIDPIFASGGASVCPRCSNQTPWIWRPPSAGAIQRVRIQP